MYVKNGYIFYLADDGTLDTVIDVYEENTEMEVTLRYDMETAASYRSQKTGELFLEDFVDDVVYDDAMECEEFWEE